MSLLSASVSITRYRVEGKLETPVLETAAAVLKKNAISEIDDQASEKLSGWTSFERPYQPDFSGSNFVFGAYLVFALRIDKKTIPAKLIQKHFMIESARRLADSGRPYLSRNEKQTLKDQVVEGLYAKVPAVPQVYDIIWNYERSILWFFSNLKAANEELETLFTRSFGLTLIRMFPYTAAQLNSNLTDTEKDILLKLEPTRFKN
ncbi:MAG: recombination-associated protein RdgC [Desulfobacterales bacterium]|jgi:DNA recombination-dependent growth factor C